MRQFFLSLHFRYFTQFCFLILLLTALTGIFAPYLTSQDPTLVDIAEKHQGISEIHWLGTDHLGRDIYSRLIYGIRTSVFYAVFAMLLTLFMGMIVGIYSGMSGNKIDERLMRLCDLMLSFPSEVMIFALVGVLGTGIEHILLAIVLVKWAWYARMIRGVVQQYMHKNYVLYAISIGTSKWHIFRQHIFPVILAELIVLGSADMGGVILLISALSFLGLGVQPPTAEWGVMLSDAKNQMLLYPEQMLPAGIAIMLVVMAFNGVGDFLRDWFDPDGRTLRGYDE